ncbi:hypothetical protein FRC07_006204 [Ceratobasidium sp. 392]|nr:hypothetical protein FRC07_006204 [Ceratobasidium sp. 392]
MDRFNLVHGNLKGSNILISNEGEAMLSGFEGSMLRESMLHFTATETPDYYFRWTAPEVFMNEVYLSTAAADVYALGMASTLLSWYVCLSRSPEKGFVTSNQEIFTGELPYSNIKNDWEITMAVAIHKRLPDRPLEQIPTNDSQGDMLWTLLTKCWQHEPEERPTAEQVYKHIKPFVIDSTMLASEIISHLGSRKCPNLTDQLEESLCTQYPLVTGGYGDIYRGSLKSGEIVALKSMMLRIGSTRSERMLLKVTLITRIAFA